MAHNNKPKTLSLAALAVLAGCLILLPAISRAHCDTLGGPVVKDGRAALEKRDITPVLKWVKPDDEGEIRSAFDSAIAVGTALCPSTNTTKTIPATSRRLKPSMSGW